MQESPAPEPSEAQLFELPEFEGVKPVGVLTRINGTGQRITRPLGIGHRVILVVETEVTGVNHIEDKGGLKRVQSLAVKDLYEAEGKTGKALLSKMRLLQKKTDDNKVGAIALDGVDEHVAGIEVTTDGNGVALTPDEVAQARGEEPPAEDLLGDDDIVPVILFFSDQSRALWPDDYLNTDYKTDPYAGDFMPNPNRENKTEDLRVIEVQDVETGEAIDEWSPTKEAATLLEAEEAAKAKEAAEDANRAPAKKPKAKGKKKSVRPPKVIIDEITEATPEIETITQSGVGETIEPALPDDEA